MVVVKEELWVPVKPERFPESTSTAGLSSFATLNDFMHELLGHAYEVARLWAISFFDHNSNVYSVGSITRGDLIQHLIATVYVQKYQGMVESDPAKWTIKGFRASFYVSCQNACRINRRFMLAKKRKATTDDIVSLDDENTFIDENQIVDPTASFSATWADRISNASPLVTRLSVLALYGTYTTPTSLIQRFKHAPMTQQQKEIARNITQRARNSGAITSPRDGSHRIIDDLPEEMIGLAEELLHNLSSGNIAAFRPPGARDSVIRSDNVRTCSAFWASVDYELLSKVFGVVLNHEVSPIIAWKVLRPKVESMGSDAWRETPDHVKNLVAAIRELAEGKSSAPRLQVSIDTVVMVQCYGDQIAITMGSMKPNEALDNLKSSPTWPHFLALIGSDHIDVSDTAINIKSHRTALFSESMIASRLRMVVSCA